jgi:murein DD-endopeptidase MepM/ murein hydrolase activator NlpD
MARASYFRQLVTPSRILLTALLCNGILAQGAAGYGDTVEAVPVCPLIMEDDCPLELPPRILESTPAAGVYPSWIQNDVSPYAFTCDQIADSVSFTLVDTLECEFVMPVPGRVTSAFGPRRYRMHEGTDIDLESGDAVRCAFDGVVRVALYSGGYGNVVVVRHFNGLETVYAHLSSMAVKPGDAVSAGDLIGLGGRTGRATGSHLHFEVRYLGLALDSRLIIDFEKGSLVDNHVVLRRHQFVN